MNFWDNDGLAYFLLPDGSIVLEDNPLSHAAAGRFAGEWTFSSDSF